MNTMMEMVDSWTKSQKELVDNLVKAQKAGIDRWAEAAAKMQESLQDLGVPQEGSAKEVRSFYASLMTTAASSTKAIAEDAVKMQEAWKGAIEKQLELAGGVMKQCAAMFQPAAAQK
jgi:hypothetical protein